MTVEQFRKMLSAQPFQPFTINLADGRQLEVPHREFVFLPPNSRTAWVADQDGAAEIIDLLLVIGLETRPPAGSAAQAS